MNKFATYCKTNFLELCVKKTKEMIIDFRKSKALPDPIIINYHTIEGVYANKYLSVMLNWQTTLITLYPNWIHAIIAWHNLKSLMLISEF